MNNYPIPSRVPLPTFRPDREQLAMTPGAASQPQQRGILDWLDNNSESLAAMSYGLLSGNTGPEQFGQGFKAFAQVRGAAKEKAKEEKKKNATLEWLRKNAPDYAGAVEAGALTAADAYKMKVEAEKPKKPNFMSVGGQIFNADNQQWISPPTDPTASGDLGLNPIYGVDENGNPVVFQASKSGGLVRAETPKGVTIMDPYNRSYQTSLGKEQGTAAGQASAQLSGVRQMADSINFMIEDLKNDPGLDRVLGPIDSLTPNISRDATRAQAKIDQIGGQAFLQARQMLKGGGAITDFESKRAEQAYARLSQAQHPDDFKAALDDFNAAVQAGAAKLDAQARSGPRPSFGAAPAAPRQGRTSSGITFTIEE